MQWHTLWSKPILSSNFASISANISKMPPRQLDPIYFIFEIRFTFSYFFGRKKSTKDQKRQCAMCDAIKDWVKADKILRKNRENQYKRRLNRFYCYRRTHSSKKWKKKYAISFGKNDMGTEKGVIEVLKRSWIFFFQLFACMHVSFVDSFRKTCVSKIH